MMPARAIVNCLIAVALTVTAAAAAERVSIVVDAQATPRVLFGIEKLSAALTEAGYQPRVIKGAGPSGGDATILVGTREKSAALQNAVDGGTLKLPEGKPGKEGFVLKSLPDRAIAVVGGDDSGTLYGCLELASSVKATRALPKNLDAADAPVFALRGPCIGMQKMEKLYDNVAYDYPYTKELFPFFYDKEHWRRYLDFLVENRMNTFYLWNGHPFTSLLKLPKYPDAREVSDEQLAENIETFNWLTREADKRGIWVIQFFYNVHISHALAKARGVPIIYGSPTPLTREYTRYCVREFVRSYPNVGVMMCLGEALSDRHDADWLCNVIIPGVKDAMRELGTGEQPPIVVRAHSTPVEEVMQAALKVYSNVYTMHKWNGESLSWNNVRGEDRRLHESLARLGSGHIVNVHLLANLEPFRWGSPEYVQTCMQNARRMGAAGLHLYPLRYWEWPITADNVQPPPQQIDRDWIWFAAWARYAWNPDPDRRAERRYWIGRLAEMYGSEQAGEKILDAYQAAGPCQPMLLGRFGITGGGRQTLGLGMLMTQLVNPNRYGVWKLLYTADAPEGERLQEWVRREYEGQPHQGETPPAVADAVEKLSAQAVDHVEAARPHVTRNQDEFERLAHDVRCIQALCGVYASKARAAMLVLRYKYSRDLADLEKALPPLEESLDRYKELVRLTDSTYREACSLHTSSRKIPFIWSKERPYRHWRDCLPEYEKELANFKRNLKQLRTAAEPASGPQKPIKPLPVVTVKALGEGIEVYEVKPGAKPFTDRDYTIRQLAPELVGMQGIRFSNTKAKQEGVTVRFELTEPAKILVGFLDGDQSSHARPPKWEWDPALLRGVVIDRFPGVTVHSHLFPAGKNLLDLGKGTFLLLGFTNASQTLQPRVVFPEGGGRQDQVDWLFE